MVSEGNEPGAAKGSGGSGFTEISSNERKFKSEVEEAVVEFFPFDFPDWFRDVASSLNVNTLCNELTSS